MSRWKALLPDLDPRVRHLVVCLRRLKDHSGLSMRQLAAKTGYSTSSWERYLGGRSLPPREAVEAIASVTGDDPTRLLALWEVAAAAWTGRRTSTTAAAGDGAEAVPETTSAGWEPPVRRRPLRGVLAAGVVAFLLVTASAVVLVVRLAEDDDGRVQRPPVSSAAPAGAGPASPAPSYACRIERIDGRWYAGLSRTRDAILLSGNAGAPVAEAQCLLRRAGFPPGDVDGIYGPRTERAVQRLQQKAGLVVDGIVGPHTWGALRG
ncbi:peptidoglycan-binding protein [Streptomyces caelestis]